MRLDPDCTLFVTTHKDYAFNHRSTWVRPIHVGGYKPNDANFVGDDTDDNISPLNASYGELTAFYWAWKNVSGPRHIGFMHYRKYFNFLMDEHYWTKGKYRIEPDDRNLAYLTSPAQKAKLLDYLRFADFVVPRPTALGMSIEDQYKKFHPAEPWDLFVQVVGERLPKYRDYLPWLRSAASAHFLNMFVCRLDRFQVYCAELFPAIDEVVRRVPPPTHQPGARFQPYRFPAFLTERFLMLYLQANAQRLFEVPVVVFEEDA